MPIDQRFDFRIVDFPGAEGFDHDRYRFGNTYCIGHLNLTFISQTGSHDVFRYVACGVSGRTIHLRGVLAGKCATAVVR